MKSMMERPAQRPTPEQLPPDKQKELFEMVQKNEREALMNWSDIIDTAKELGVDLDAALDPREEEPAYKDLKDRLLKLKDETLKILFDLENEKEAFRALGYVIES